MPKTYLCSDESATAAAGREIARSLAPDAVVHLVGDLGAGKTFLARAIAAELGANAIEVASPSFAIVHEYPIAGGAPIIHIDGYRLSENRREWLEIGIPELIQGPGVKLIEWPKREFAEFEDGHVEITIGVEEDGGRVIEVTPAQTRVSVPHRR
ncbi:MAG TPA: tRNA (adenosine(37)-N6)-threonylcarbamoyltransferase complex ATPase subunit type 1 TsaE [Thermoanaerobaculia bacterium]